MIVYVVKRFFEHEDPVEIVAVTSTPMRAYEAARRDADGRDEQMENVAPSYVNEMLVGPDERRRWPQVPLGLFRLELGVRYTDGEDWYPAGRYEIGAFLVDDYSTYQRDWPGSLTS